MALNQEEKTLLREIHENTIVTKTLVEGHAATLLDHESRIRQSEKARFTLIGWAAGGGAGLTALYDAIKAKIGG